MGYPSIALGLLIGVSSYFIYVNQMALEGTIEYVGGGQFVRHSTDYFTVALTILGMMIGLTFSIVGSFILISQKNANEENREKSLAHNSPELNYNIDKTINNSVKVRPLCGQPIGRCPRCAKIILKGWKRCLHCDWTVNKKELKRYE